MFDGDFPKSLDESVFNDWLEKGRQSRIGYHYLVVIWDDFEAAYQPLYIERREELEQYAGNASYRLERMVAAYDLYSESRIL